MTAHNRAQPVPPVRYRLMDDEIVIPGLESLSIGFWRDPEAPLFVSKDGQRHALPSLVALRTLCGLLSPPALDGRWTRVCARCETLRTSSSAHVKAQIRATMV